MSNNLTVAASQRILDALAARIANGSVFTAYDVTTDARDGTDDRIDHPDVQGIVHNEWMTGQFPSEYNRDDQVTLDKAPSQPLAIMYYPDSKNPQHHPLVSSSQVPSASGPMTGHYQPSPTAVPASVITPPKKGGNVKIDDVTYECSVTAEGRINVPKSLLDQCDCIGGTYDVSVGSNTIYKAKNSDGRVRIRASELGGGSKFRVSVKTTTTKILEVVRI